MIHHWLDKTEYPFAPQYFAIKGQKMHYIDEGKGDVILFVHGTPSWSFDFRNVIKILCKSHRCIAVDHIGFGLSDKPEIYDYSTQNHSASLESFVTATGLNNITLVVHDFGGPIGLDFAMRHPNKVKNLVILNSWLWSIAAEPEYKKLRKLLKSPLLPILYKYFNFSPRYLLPKSYGEKKLNNHLLQQYIRPFANSRQRNGALAFAKSLLHDQDWFASLWNKKELICDKPTLFIWGMKDPVILPKYLDKFISGFDNSKVQKLENSGHFPQEEQPESVANSILEFI